MSQQVRGGADGTGGANASGRVPGPLGASSPRGVGGLPFQGLLMAALTGILLLSSSLVGFWLARERSGELHQELRAKGTVWARILSAHAEYGVLVGDREGLTRLLHGLRHDADVVWARVLDADGSELAEGPGTVHPPLLKELEQQSEAVLRAGEGGVAAGGDTDTGGPERPTGLASRFLPPVTQAELTLSEGRFLWMQTAVTTFRVRQTPEELALGGGASTGPGHQERIGRVQLLFSLSRVDAAVLATWRSFGLAAGGMVLLGLLLALPLTRRIVRPVQALATASRRIAEGELSVQVPEAAISEIAELASAFHLMVQGLLERDHRLAANAAELERRADALQTRQEELLVANSELLRLNETLQALNQELHIQRDALHVSNQSLHLKQEQLYESNRELLRTSDLKSTFLATMSHELRTPLNSILGYTQVLLDELDGPLNGDQRDSLERVQRNGQHLLGLINEVLDFSRLEAGRLELQAQPFDPVLLAEECLELVRPLARGKPIQLGVDAGRLLESVQVAGSLTSTPDPDSTPADSTEADLTPADPGTNGQEDAPWEFIGDASRLRQVLLNLLSNAVYYTEKGHVQLHVRLGSSHLELAVQDTGRGIPEEEHTLIFEPFRRVKGTPGQGSGLGLPISRRLVEAMGGTLRVRSSVGQGSLFTVWLPASGPAPESGLPARAD